MEKRPFESHLGLLGARIRFQRFREEFYILGAWFVIGFLVLVLFDWRFQLPPTVCLGLGLVFLGTVLWLSGRGVRRVFRRLRPDQLAVMAEADNPAMDNILVNAVQFQGILASEVAPAGVSRAMMDEELRLADELALRVDLEGNLSRDTLRRRWRLFLAAAVIAGTGLWLGRDAVRAIVPRYLDPWGDHPPYSRTRFVLEPRFATVNYGDSVELAVRTEGKRARDVRLLVRSQEEAWRPLPLFVQGDDEYHAKLESIENDLEFLVHAHRSRSHIGRVRVDKTPRVREVVVTYRFPAYTRFESRVQPLPESGIEAVRKTEVTLEVRSNRPLEGGWLSVPREPESAGSEIPMATTSAKWVSAAFPLVESGSFSIRLTDVDRRASAQALTGNVRALPDGEPEVVIREPETFSLATPAIEIPVEVEARDDFGITAFDFFVMVDGEAREPVRSEMDPDSPDSYGAASFEVVPEALGAEPGETIEIFARAWDNDPEGSKAGSSPIHSIRIITDDEYRRMLRELQTAEDLSAQYRDLLEEVRSLYNDQKSLRERTEELARDLESPGLMDAERELLEGRAVELAEEERLVARRTESLAERIRERAESEPVLDIEEQFNSVLASHAEELARLSREPMPEAADALTNPATPSVGDGTPSQEPGSPSSQQVALSIGKQAEAEQSLERMLGEGREQIEQVLRRIEDIMRLYADIVRLAQLYEEQKRVAAEASPHRGREEAAGEEARDLRRIASGQEDVWNGSVEVQQDLCDHARAFIDDASLASVIPKIEAVAEALDDLYIIPNTGLGSLSMARGNGKAGSERAEAAREGFRLLFEGECGQCKGSGACQSLCFGLGQALGIGSLPVPGMGMPLGSGSGQGSGLTGGSGMGAAGDLGAAISQLAMNAFNQSLGTPTSSMSLYGPDTPEGVSQTRLSSSRRAKADNIDAMDGASLANISRETVNVQRREDVSHVPGAAEGYAEAYRRLVEEYFRRLAEEGR